MNKLKGGDDKTCVGCPNVNEFDEAEVFSAWGCELEGKDGLDVGACCREVDFPKMEEVVEAEGLPKIELVAGELPSPFCEGDIGVNESASGLKGENVFMSFTLLAPEASSPSGMNIDSSASWASPVLLAVSSPLSCCTASTAPCRIAWAAVSPLATAVRVLFILFFSTR